MSRSPHHVPMPRRGRIYLQDGDLVVEREDGQEFGRFMVSEDGLVYNGGEISIAQKGDPAALRLITLCTEGHRGLGKISLCNVRPDGRGDEVGFVLGALDDDVQLSADGVPDHHRGKLQISLREDTPSEPRPVAVWSQYRSQERFGVRTFYAAIKRSIASLWVHAPAGEGVEPYCGASGGGGGGLPRAVDSDDVRYFYNVQGDATPDFPYGRIVQYRREADGSLTPVAILRPERIAPDADPAKVTDANIAPELRS